MPKRSYSRSRSKDRDLDSSSRDAQELTTEEWEEKARQILLNRLSRGPRSKLQLAQLLAQREIPEEVARPILERFAEVGLIDDRSFAEAFANDRRSSRGLAKRALARELGTVGISDEVVQEVLDTIEDSDDLKLATRLVRRRWSSVEQLEWQSRQRRLFGFLGRRGFSASVISAAIAAVESEERSGLN